MMGAGKPAGFRLALTRIKVIVWPLALVLYQREELPSGRVSALLKKEPEP